MTDLIDRQEALDALRTCYDTNLIVLDNGDELIHYGDAVGAIEALPSAQPVWIPVTERLPERYDNYLITTSEEDIDIGTFHPEFKHWSICDADGFMWMDGVLAWCELPTPYLEGGQDESDD